jgi:hypothetical protein
MKNIPQGRALIYIILICLIPSLFAGFWVLSERSSLNQVERSIEELRDAAFLKEKRQATNQSVRSHFRDADHFFIDKYIENLTLLEPEVEALQKLVNQKNFPDDEAIKKRLEFLTGAGNDIVFTEGVVQNYGVFKETTETMVHPVEVNVQDLQKILSRVEGVKIGEFAPESSRPQLLILDFKLDKKKTGDKSEVFLLNMKLLKREYL